MLPFARFLRYCDRMIRRMYLLIFLILLAPVASAAERPWLLHLPGIGGKMPIDLSMTKGLHDGFDPQIEIYDWTCNQRGLAALLAYQRNHQQALLVAKMIQQEYHEHPETPIMITAHSGGTGIAIWALEALPDDVKVDTVVLLASAISPGYDLSPAMKHISKNLYNIFSPFDSTVLGMGTSTFGTIDGVKTEAAGKVGFLEPVKADASLYKKLVQMPYQNWWIEFNNFGDHVGPMSRLFARMYLTPLLLHEKLPTSRPAEITQKN